MAFRGRSGKTSGVCRHCNSLPNHYGECKCSMGKGVASCEGCGAKGTTPNIREDMQQTKQRIGCICSSIGEHGPFIREPLPSKPETMKDSDISGKFE